MTIHSYHVGAQMRDEPEDVGAICDSCGTAVFIRTSQRQDHADAHRIDRLGGALQSFVVCVDCTRAALHFEPNPFSDYFDTDTEEEDALVDAEVGRALRDEPGSFKGQPRYLDARRRTPPTQN